MSESMKLNKVKAEEMGHQSQVSILAAARGGILEHNKKVALTSGNIETFILLPPPPPHEVVSNKSNKMCTRSI
jgi:hypothetical protein